MESLLAVIHWDFDPVIFEVFGHPIRYYGVFFALAFYLGYLILSKIFRKENVSQDDLDKLTLYMVIGTVIGARLGHCLFYHPEDYLSNPIEILKIWEGGLASHGAAVGILLAVFLYSRKVKNQPFLWVIDRISIVVALAGLFIRSGNLMNSEIVGKPANVPWAFIFERIPEPPTPRHPVQLYEALAYLAVFGFLLWLYRKKDGKFEYGWLLGWFLVLVFTARFILEYFKAAQAEFREALIMNMGQLLSIPFIIAGIIILAWVNKKANARQMEQKGNN